MKRIPNNHFRILAIAPTTRGFGFAVLEGQETLIDWGVKRIERDKNVQSLAMVKKLMAHYQPGVMVLQDTLVKNSHRAPRIKALTKRVIALAVKRNVSVKLFTIEKVRQVFFADGKGTKHMLAEIIAKRFPRELGCCLPPKRRAWTSEDSRMDIFDAVALALVFRNVRA